MKVGPDPNANGNRGTTGPGFPTLEEMDNEIGGVDGFFTIFGLHYCRIFADPRMQVLIDSRHKNSNVSAMDHGKRTSSTLLDIKYNTRYFADLGHNGSRGDFAVMSTHQQAKRCPMRPKEDLRHGKFTINQRDTWVGNVILSAEEVGASKAFVDKLGTWLARNVSVYAPFYNEETGKEENEMHVR